MGCIIAVVAAIYLHHAVIVMQLSDIAVNINIITTIMCNGRNIRYTTII